MGSKQAKTPPHVSLGDLRESHGLTAAELGKKVGEILGTAAVSRGTISAIENGSRGASQPMLDAIAIALNMKPGRVTTDYEPKNPRGRSVRPCPLPPAVGQ